MNRLGQQQIRPAFLITILVIAAVLFVPGIRDAVIGFLGGTDDGGGAPPTGQGGVCPAGVVIEDTTVTISSEGVYTAGTSVGTAYYWLNGIRKGHLASGGSFDASPGDNLKVLYAENSTTYYGLYKEYTVPCKGTYEVFEQLYPMSTSEDWDVVVTNDDGQVNSESFNQTIGLGTPETVTIEIEPQWKKALGNPYLKGKVMNILSCQYNSSAYDKLELSVGGSLVSTVGKPDIVESAQASTKWTSWAIDPLWNGLVTVNGLSQKNTWIGQLTIDPDDATHNPADCGAATPDYCGDIYCRVDDVDYDLDAVTYDLLQGVMDEEMNNLGVTTIVFNFTIEVD